MRGSGELGGCSERLFIKRCGEKRSLEIPLGQWFSEIDFQSILFELMIVIREFVTAKRQKSH